LKDNNIFPKDNNIVDFIRGSVKSDIPFAPEVVNLLEFIKVNKEIDREISQGICCICDEDYATKYFCEEYIAKLK